MNCISKFLINGERKFLPRTTLLLVGMEPLTESLSIWGYSHLKFMQYYEMDP